MEEQRQRQEDEARRSGAPLTGQEGVAVAAAAVPAAAPASTEDVLLERALAMSMDHQPSHAAPAPPPPAASAAYPDFATMTEEEQIAYAMQMSMQETRRFFQTELFK